MRPDAAESRGCVVHKLRDQKRAAHSKDPCTQGNDSCCSYDRQSCEKVQDSCARQAEGSHSPEGPNSAYDVRDVFSDLIGGLQAEQVEVAQQVVMEGQKLQVQLWQRQAILACMQTLSGCWHAHKMLESGHEGRASRNVGCIECVLSTLLHTG